MHHLIRDSLNYLGILTILSLSFKIKSHNFANTQAKNTRAHTNALDSGNTKFTIVGPIEYWFYMFVCCAMQIGYLPYL